MTCINESCAMTRVLLFGQTVMREDPFYAFVTRFFNLPVITVFVRKFGAECDGLERGTEAPGEQNAKPDAKACTKNAKPQCAS